MEKKPRILGWIDQIDQLELDLASKLSAEQRNKTGTLKTWEPKEILAHSAIWLERLLANIERVQQGEAIQNYENYLEINDQDFAEFSKLSWEEALERSHLARQTLHKILPTLSEADLDNREYLPSKEPRPLWQRLISNAVEHPIYHLSTIYNQIGEADAFTEIYEKIFNEMAELDTQNIEWRGVMRYNLACQYALTGRKQAAVAALKDSLKLNPGLTEWSKEDPDFASLREDSEYLEIYKS
jgi:tetratricopeptide (TPR) repeat protein